MAVVAAAIGSSLPADALPGRGKKHGVTTTTLAATTSTSTSTTLAPPTTTTVAPTTTTTAAPARQAWTWPFRSDSPWNVGVGSGAMFESAAAPATSSLLSAGVTPWVNAGSYSHPVFRAAASDPIATVTRPGTTEITTYRIPNAATPASGTDHHMHVVDPTGRWVDESWLMQGANPTWTTGYHVRNDLQSSGSALAACAPTGEARSVA
jgi:hypothetical protein